MATRMVMLTMRLNGPERFKADDYRLLVEALVGNALAKSALYRASASLEWVSVTHDEVIEGEYTPES